MKKRICLLTMVIVTVICLLSVTFLSGCDDGDELDYKKNPSLDTSTEVQLRIASGQQTWPEIENIITMFEEIYPNCSIVCDYIEEYTTNLPVRLNHSEQKVDIFRTTNIQSTTEYKDNALNLISEESKKTLDLSGTNKGLVKNFQYMGEPNTQYAIPFGGEMRGMYVNVTLLNKYGLSVPKNRAELLNCFKVLKNNGYIPLQGSSGTVAQQLLYPYICNSIVNGGDYENMYAAIENIEEGISEYFRDPYTLMYEIVENGYYDYKRVETELDYRFEGNAGKAREFLNITAIDDNTYEKQDDIGKMAFIVDTQAFKATLDKTKSDYHSEIEYKFIVSPVGVDGGYAYLSPADGLAINKNSDNTVWALEFLNFLFTPKVNKIFATDTGKIPNTFDALVQFDIPADRACDVGQVTFSYPFYKTVTTPLLSGYSDMIGISKMNAPKYMNDNGDGTYSIIFTLEDYMARLEAEFQKVKANL